jgi:hypothetical protein
MKFSQSFIPTLKETPAEAEVISHKLMLRAGLIRKLSSGIYTWLPMGLRVLRKVEAHHPRGDGPGRGPGDSHARRCSLPSCGRNPAAGSTTARSCSASRTATTMNTAWPPPTRRSWHRPGAPRDPLLPRHAQEHVPGADQVPRRDPAPLRRDALPRIHHEGRLFL